MTSKVIEGHKRYYVFKNQLFLKYLFCLTFDLNQILYVQSFDQITTLTYVLLEKFCPWFIIFLEIFLIFIISDLITTFTYVLMDNGQLLIKESSLKTCS